LITGARFSAGIPASTGIRACPMKTSTRADTA
jgi:hypothetical protein